MLLTSVQNLLCVLTCELPGKRQLKGDRLNNFPSKAEGIGDSRASVHNWLSGSLLTLENSMNTKTPEYILHQKTPHLKAFLMKAKPAKVRCHSLQIERKWRRQGGSRPVSLRVRLLCTPLPSIF